jgi:putative transposase
VVYAEDLCVSGLARTRLARSVVDAGWAQLVRLIGEKAAQYGRAFARIGRFEPTSQVCSARGGNDGPKPLSIRTWECARCGAVLDRDVNAAKNILAAGRADRLNACGGDVRPELPWRLPMKQEPTGAWREPRWRSPAVNGVEDVK